VAASGPPRRFRVVSTVGTVGQIAVHPVKSLAGRTQQAVLIKDTGLAGDRAWTVVDATTGERITAREAPAIAEVVATGDTEADSITLAELLGRPVRLQRGDAPQVDAAPVHLVSREALRRAQVGDVPEGCSASDPRANLVLHLHGGSDEREWVGKTLRVGQAELAVTRTPKHCLGVYAEVKTPGKVHVGDPIELLD
jgi:uncharacterized protein YcbX